MHMPFGSVAALLLALSASQALAESGDRASGEALARTWCANCHGIRAAGPASTDDAAPRFEAIARMPSTTSLSLRAFLQTPHVNMPDYSLTRRQLDDVVSYILSLRAP